MKKILTILSGMSMLAVAGGSVIACGNSNKYDHEDSKGDSILVDGLGNFNFADGTTNVITTSDILNKIINTNGDSSLRGKLISRFISLLSAGFLAKGDSTTDINKDWFSTDISKNPYLSNGLGEKLKAAFNELESRVATDIKTERDSYNDKYGKKAGSKWKTMLKEKFPGINDLDLLESKYKELKILSDDDNVNTRLLNILLSTNQAGITWVDKETLISDFEAYENSPDKPKWITDNKEVAQQLIWSTMAEGYKKSTDDKLQADFDAAIKAVTDIKYDAPTDINDLEKSTTYATKGFLSNSQRFFLDKYYKAQAPIAISQATIAFAENGKMDDGIEVQDFEPTSPTPADTLRIKNVNDFLDKSKFDANWNDLLGGGEHKDITKKSITKLLTLSNSTDFSQMLRNAVYNYVLKPSTTTNKLSNVNEDDGLAAIINKINRSDSATMYTEIAPGVIAFIDADGLQIVRIEGYDKLKSKPTGGNEGIIEKDDEKDDEKDGPINEATLNELSSFRQFQNMTEAEKIDAVQAAGYADTKDTIYSKVNSHIVNPYLKFLVNESLIKGVAGAYNSFDIVSEMKDYVKIVQPGTDGTFNYWTGLLDYFYQLEIAGKKDEDKLTFNGFFDEYFKVGDGENTDSSQKIIDNIKGWINSVEATEENDNVEQFIAKQIAENKATEDNAQDTYPKGVFDIYKEKDLHKSVDGIWFSYDESQPTPPNSTFNINQNLFLNYFKGGNE